MNMRISGSVQKQIQPLVNFPRAINSSFFRRKDKVVFVVGPTGTGKSQLAIDLATRIPAEVINCDKMQVYKGLDTLTNKVTDQECRGVPHHLLGIVDDPSADFTCDDFRNHASDALKLILSRDRLPIIAGGSNSFIEALAYNDPEFRLRYECCFLWVDVSLPVLHSFVSERVDRMVKAGLIEEVRNMFDPNITDYSKGIRRAIGVPELDEYFRSEGQIDAKTRDKILDLGISKIKENTCILARRQLRKIQQLHNRWSNRNIHRIDATEVFLKTGGEDSEKAWEKLVAGPSAMIVEEFLYHESIIPSQHQHSHHHHHLATSGGGVWGPLGKWLVPFPNTGSVAKSNPQFSAVIKVRTDFHYIIIILIQYTGSQISNSKLNDLSAVKFGESIYPLVLLQFCTINKKKKRVKEEKKALSQMLESVYCFEE
ncbi:adenylate isopentenyltransferase 5, chloroplastic-like [Euphorbia lathyris]|uniref:adenylate isopentenyltransferase 5, chloroplastic-like n=1 Tax=Euphorbia lathyris TaxID=212925 RepID=UPI0033139301